MRPIVVTADDFGLCEEVNEAVEEGHRNGILSAASLMASAPAAADAVARAHRLPNLRVGLHLVLVDGRPTLPPDRIPHLVETNGSFPTDLVRAGVRWFFSPAARRELEREIRAQFEAFRATGLAFDHVNGHNHMHLHPTVLGIVLRCAAEFGVPGLRLPYEPASLAGVGAHRTNLSERIAHCAALPWAKAMRRKIAKAGLRHNDTLLGLRASGHMNPDVVLAFLERLPEGIVELYFHPAARRTQYLSELMPGYDNEAEFKALVSPVVSARMRTLGLLPVGFSDLS